MHTTEFDGVNFHHDGDFTGEVVIHDGRGWVVKVPAAAIKAFVAAWKRQVMISAIEDMTDDDAIFAQLPGGKAHP